MQRDDTFSILETMTHVILSNGFDEKHIAFPTPERFQDYLKQVRRLAPDRSWQITESWEK